MQMAARFWQALGTALIFLVVANIGLHALFIWRYSGPQAHSAIYSEFSEERRASYAGMTAQDVDGLLAETWTRPGDANTNVCNSGFHEVPRTTRFVNASADGIRYTAGAGNGRMSKVDFKRTLLLFGGSTDIPGAMASRMARQSRRIYNVSFRNTISLTWVVRTTTRHRKTSSSSDYSARRLQHPLRGIPRRHKREMRLTYLSGRNGPTVRSGAKFTIFLFVGLAAPDYSSAAVAHGKDAGKIWPSCGAPPLDV